MDEKIKVTDKRMFTPEGELREAVPESGESAATDRDAPEPEKRAPSAPREASEAAPAAGPAAATDRPEDDAPRRRFREQAEGPQGDLPPPTFVDLIGLLAQPIAMFLGDARIPGGEAEENLPLARFHIDLLELVQSKTKGNVSPEEAKLLEDLLYRLRMRYLEKKG